MRTDTANRVLVAGAGIAGSAVVRALHRRGISALALEQRPGEAGGGLAVNLPGNAIRALADLGLAGALDGLGTPLRRRDYRTDGDRLLFAVDEAAFWGPDARPRCLRRADLLRLLRRDLPAGAIREGVGVVGHHQDAAGVTVALSDGTVERGGLLVGADGVHSTVRRGLFGDQAPAAARLASASWRFMTPNPGLEAWTLWAGRDGLFLLIPVDADEAYGWATVQGVGAENADLGAQSRAFDGFPRRVRDTLAAVLARPEAIHHAPLEEIRLLSWTRGRVLLAGDAAHATAPVWAQGVALALEDALVLADLVADGTDPDRIGALYETRRRPRVAHVQAMTDRLSRTARMPGWARRLLLPVIGPRSYRATYGPLREPVTG
ncbi:FAD-dependent monooxygenase [Methylobacterium sp. Leaf118]|uniref:FAD-dependent monooxygenase n=1 Tax=Methylobacterium sp. Leaf118 TaxID=2876562 RepID=UPI001E534027|nr:FAD-dependent monooxygenase [Methylobacterium sp. Leaf118]